MTQRRGSCGRPWISCTPEGDTGFYLENGKIIWVVEAIKRTFKEWSEFVIKRGHMDAVHVAFVRNLLTTPPQEYQWDFVDPPEGTKNYIDPTDKVLR